VLNAGDLVEVTVSLCDAGGQCIAIEPCSAEILSPGEACSVKIGDSSTDVRLRYCRVDAVQIIPGLILLRGTLQGPRDSWESPLR
jgi:hypothetical protein